MLSRLHPGHSYITHSFLLKGDREEPPMCTGCDERLTIIRILLTCSDFIEIRESHFTAQSLRILFQSLRILFQDSSLESLFRLTAKIYLSTFLVLYMSTGVPVHHYTCSVYLFLFGITSTITFQLNYVHTDLPENKVTCLSSCFSFV